MAATDLFTLADLANQVCLNVGATDDLTQAKAKKWINRAIVRFSEMGEWSWQYRYAQALNTVAGQKEYAVTNCYKVQSIYTEQPIQRALRLIEDRTYRQLFPNETAQGAPYFWRTMGWSSVSLNTQQIGLYPIPDAVYNLKIDLVAPISLLSSDSDDIRLVTRMPSMHVDLVIEMATAIGFKEIDDAQGREQLEETIVRLKGAYEQDGEQIEDVLIMRAFERGYSDQYYLPQLPPTFSGWTWD